MPPNILAIDQGTTSTRVMLFDETGRALATAQRMLPQQFPRNGWVEHNPEDIWQATRELCQELIASHGRPAAIGIANQRETTLVWERKTGRPIHPAIVWQDRRTEAACRSLRNKGLEKLVSRRTGLVLDPYFSASKIAWLLRHVPEARARARRGELAFGTVDSFLLWRLTGRHATDASNAARTALFDIHKQAWDSELCAIWDIPMPMLPEVLDNQARFGDTHPELFGAPIPVLGMAGDQQAAAIGQACLRPGDIKSTYGTGCFVLLHTGPVAVRSKNRLLTTVAARLNGRALYALEGSIFNAGTAVQWLRDGLGVIGGASDTETLAAALPDNRGVYLVPAFTGLGAPWWDAGARGLLCGLTRDTGPAELARAALESVAYQTQDLLAAMAADGAKPGALRVDGGMTRNNWLLQFLADITGLPVERPREVETTALGAALLAGAEAGLYPPVTERDFAADRHFDPALSAYTRKSLLRGWRQAVARTRA